MRMPLMTRVVHCLPAWAGVLLLFASYICAQNPAQPPKETQSVELVSKALTGLPGKDMLLLTVVYAPGAASAKHRHNADVVMYVLEGAIVMQVEGSDPVTLHTGQTFYEAATDIHTVARNASDTQPAKVLVFFVKDHGAPRALPMP